METTGMKLITRISGAMDDVKVLQDRTTGEFIVAPDTDLYTWSCVCETKQEAITLAHSLAD